MSVVCAVLPSSLFSSSETTWPRHYRPTFLRSVPNTFLTFRLARTSSHLNPAGSIRGRPRATTLLCPPLGRSPDPRGPTRPEDPAFFPLASDRRGGHPPTAADGPSSEARLACKTLISRAGREECGGLGGFECGVWTRTSEASAGRSTPAAHAGPGPRRRSPHVSGPRVLSGPSRPCP